MDNVADLTDAELAAVKRYIMPEDLSLIVRIARTARLLIVKMSMRSPRRIVAIYL